MRDIRVYHASPLTDDTDFELSPAATHHLVRVLRLQAGVELVVFDGSGREWPATLTDVKSGRIHTGWSRTVTRESPMWITLVQGVARGEKMDWTIQKAVELGVAAIVPVITQRTTVRLDPDRAQRRREHWQGVVIAACEQCGRTRVPQVAAPIPLEHWLSGLKDPSMVLDPRAACTLSDAWSAPPSRMNVLVGPEGGLDENEVRAVVEAGCIPVWMGPRVLRTETAGLAALAALQTLYGDLSVRAEDLGDHVVE